MSEPAKPSERLHVILAAVLVLAVVVGFGAFIYFVQRGASSIASNIGDASVTADGGGPTTQQNGTRIIEVAVVDGKTQKPIPEATVSGNIVGNVDEPVPASPDGHFRVVVPTNADVRITITARAPGRATLAASWAPSGKLPVFFTFPLSASADLSGQVVDAQGQPVPGATVLAFVNGGGLTPPLRPAFRTKPLLTDDHGHWTIPGLPSDGISVQFGTFDLMRGGNEQGFFGLDRVSDTDLAKMRDGSYVTTLPPSRMLIGRVVDGEGQPVPNASVSLGGDSRTVNAIPAVKTDADGRYQIGIRPDAQVTLTFRATGFAPEIAAITNSADVGVVTQKLSPGATIAGRVVDTAGKPVPRATINIESWHNTRSLAQTLTADGNGHFEWHDAPNDAVSVSANQRGYASTSDIEIKAGQDNVITLTPPQTFTGTVIDAETKQPITNFTSVVGIAWSPQQEPQFQRGSNVGERPTTKSPGAFSYTFTYSYPSRVIQVEADGYAPADSPPFAMSGGNQTFTFEMHRDVGLAGVLNDASGKPASGITLYLTTAGQQMQIANGKVADYSVEQAQTATSGADGSFHFPSQNRDYLIVGSSDAGYVHTTRDELKKSTTLTLEPWAKVTGTVFIGSKPAAKAVLSGWWREETEYRPDRPQFNNQVTASADDQGHFTFDRVPPGHWSIGRYGAVGDQSYALLSSQPLDAKPGETTSVTIGNIGRPITGRVELPPELKGRSDIRLDAIRLSSRTPAMTPPWKPEQLQAMTAEQRLAFLQSDEVKQFMARQAEARQTARYYAARLNGDGTFRFDDVVVGTYDVEGQFYQMTPDGRYTGGMPKATLRQTGVEVVAGDVDTPIELPAIIATIYDPRPATRPADRPTTAPTSGPSTQPTSQP